MKCFVVPARHRCGGARYYHARPQRLRCAQAVVLFGGGGDGAPLNDTWMWDGQTWVEQHPLTSPSGRVRAAMAFDQNHGQILLFGGEGADKEFTDIWVWAGAAWIQQQPATNPSGPGLESHMIYSTALRAPLLFVTPGSVLNAAGRKSSGPSELWAWR